MSELIYDALMLGRNKNVAREEYLTANGDKAPFSFEAQEKSITFSNVMNDTTGIVHLKVCSEGYGEIEVYSQDLIISFERKVITTEDFKNGTMEFTFNVLSEKLHDGRNFARIVFRTPICSASVDIVVDNTIRLGLGEKSSKQKAAALCRAYIDLRLGNLFQTEWQQKTLDIIGEVNGSNVSDMFLMLYKANVLIASECMDEARHIIDFVGSQIQKLPGREWDLLCYLYYISSLYEMNDSVTKNMLSRVKNIYELHPSWKILWVLLYMDAEFSRSPRAIIDAIEGEFLVRNCFSPVMFYEAVEAFKKDTSLMAEPSRFVLQVMSFAAREDFLSIEVCVRFAELIWQCDEHVLNGVNLTVAARILKAGYDRYGSNIILKSLCRALVCSGCRDKEYHVYFAKAIGEFLETRDIYHYFIYTADREQFVRLPEAVLEFFAGREYELGADRDYYFACLIKQKKESGPYFEKALGNMIRSASEAIDKGLVNDSLAVIYRYLMDSEELPKEKYQRMLEILCTGEVYTENALVVSVLVFQREFNEYSESQLKNGRALVRLFARDAVILFKDVAGNLYYGIDYELRTFMPKQEYVRTCMRNSPITRYMLVGDNLQTLRDVKEPCEILDYLYSNIGKGHLRSSYEQEILQDLIVYFSRNTKDKQVYGMLLDFLKFNIESSTRARLIEVMIDRLMYREAYEEIEKNGFECVSDKHVAELVHVLAEITDYEDDPVMEELASSAFMNSPFDPVVFTYMCRRYNGRMDILILMYVEARSRGIKDISISERILAKIVELKEFPDEAESIFAGYFAEGNDVELKLEFMTCAAERYLYRRDRSQEYIFRYIESALINHETFADNVIAAYLLCMVQKEEPERRSLRVIEEQLVNLVRRGIMFEEFKGFGRFFDLPATLVNSVIAQSIAYEQVENESEVLTRETMFGQAPKISFELWQRGGKASGAESMKEVCRGCYIKVFTLFYGESVEYSIDGGTRKRVGYADLKIARDESRFSELDNMIRLLNAGSEGRLKESMTEYYKKAALMEKLF